MTDGDRSDPFDRPPAPGAVRDLTPPGGQPLPRPDELDPPVLDTFKRSPARADSTRVNDAIGGRPRLNWNPVTDSGGDAPPREQRDDSGGFAFNLGNALARLGIDDDGHLKSADRDPLASLRSSLGVTSPETPPRSSAPAAPAASAPSIEIPALERRERTSPVPGEPPAAPSSFADNLPRRTSSAPSVIPSDQVASASPAAPAPVPVAAAPVRPPIAEPAPLREPDDVGASTRPYVTTGRSVFDDVVSPSPALPPTVASDPARPVAAAAPEAPAQTMPTMPTVPTVPPTTTPVLAPVQVPATPAEAPAAKQQYAHVPGSSILPTLPDVVPAAPPPVAFVPEPDTSQADIRALRSAQLRAGRQRRTGKVIGRALLIVLVLGGIVAAALTFGRSYLFPVEWDPALTELVDEIQADRGAEFQHTVGLVVQPDGEFDATVTRLLIGDGWLARVPEWRALGLVVGDPTPEGIAPDVAAGTLAIYDPAVDRIYMPESANVTLAGADLRLALEHAYDAQLGQTPVTPSPASSIAGISSTDVLAQRSVDRYIARRDAAAAQPFVPTASNLPLPIAYEMLATDALGEAVLLAAGADPTTATFATDVSTVLPTVLDDRAVLASAAPLQVGERSLGEPVSLGIDDWSLVWGARLPAATVDQLVPLVIADSYQAIDRSGTTCVSGVFEAGNPDQAAVLLSAMTTWVTGAPVGSASTTALSETRVQLIACDPGAAAAVTAPIEAASALVDRQLVRLAG